MYSLKCRPRLTCHYGDMMEYLIAWLVFPFATASLARGKNRKIYLGGLLGLLLGPFAILIVALIKPAPGADQGYN